MPLAVVSKTIKPRSKLFDDRQFRRELQLINKRTAQAMRRDYEKTTATWDEDVTFEQITSTRGGDITVFVGTDNRIYYFIDKGTRVRRALMSPDFEPKTRPGSLRSRPGKGGVVFISRKLNLPGIEARDFSGQITRKYEKPYRRQVHQAMRAARNRARR